MPNKRGEAISFLIIFFWPGTKYVKVIKQLKLLLKLKNSKLTQEEISAILVIWQYKKRGTYFLWSYDFTSKNNWKCFKQNLLKDNEICDTVCSDKCQTSRNQGM